MRRLLMEGRELLTNSTFFSFKRKSKALSEHSKSPFACLKLFPKKHLDLSPLLPVSLG